MPNTIKLKSTTTENPSLPTLADGEIAINRNANNISIYVKNDANNTVDVLDPEVNKKADKAGDAVAMSIALGG
tara:strand:- start:1375 stop:1593 length:219 start_codon:yes stop_codon:yes gene_type:complete